MSLELDSVRRNGAINAPGDDAFANVGPDDTSIAVRSDRPAYRCPRCKQRAMQFYSQLPDDPRRTDAFCCCACGSVWDV